MVQLSSSGVCFAVCFILFWINILIGLKKKAAVQKQEDVKFTVTDILQKVNTKIIAYGWDLEKKLDLNTHLKCWPNFVT